MHGTLVLVRHGQSEFNLRNLYTGRRDPKLTRLGIEQARAAGHRLAAEGYRFDTAFTSELLRARHTLHIILHELAQTDLTIVADGALNERDYGALAGLDRQQAVDRFGKINLRAWRKTFDAAPPGGESIREMSGRVSEFYSRSILPLISEGKHVLVVAHSNSLRALIMRIELLHEEEAASRRPETGIPLAYQLDADGAVASCRTLRP
jgi:2,3-bisphosphoglycerate-dependent phosphoglycerate mutase